MIDVEHKSVGFFFFEGKEGHVFSMVFGAIFLLLLAIVLFRYLKHALQWKGFPGLSPLRSLPMVGHAYVFR